ncbi:MAG: hypothetical protein LBS86_07530 [Treponema sp.]|nr:hypothetical protein [Treponema sp.]
MRQPNVAGCIETRSLSRSKGRMSSGSTGNAPVRGRFDKLSDRVSKGSERVSKRIDRVSKLSERVSKRSDRVSKGSERVSKRTV